MEARNGHTLVSDIHPISLQYDILAMLDPREPNFDNLAASA